MISNLKKNIQNNNINVSIIITALRVSGPRSRATRGVQFVP